MTTIWSQSYAKHFVDNIHPYIARIGAWMLRPFGLDLATTNQSEMYSYVLNRLQEWKEAPVDVMALSLYRLAQFHLTEITRSLCGQGDYRLCDSLQPISDIVRTVVTHPNNVVARIRDSALHDEIEPHDIVTVALSSQSMSPMPSTSSSAATSQDDQQDDEPDDDAASDHRSQNTLVLTSAERAAAVIHNQ